MAKVAETATRARDMAEAKGAILGTESMKDGDEVGKRQTYEYNATLVKIKAHNKTIHKVHTYHSSSIAALVESGMIVRVSGHQSLLQHTLECVLLLLLLLLLLLVTKGQRCNATPDF